MVTEGDPARITWQAPDNAPSGTKVQILRRSGTSCDFAATGDQSTPPRFPTAIDVSEVALDAGPQTFTTSVNERDYCFGVHTVNASGAGGPLSTETLTLYVPEPPAPTVHWVRVPYSDREYGDYQAEVDLPAGFPEASLWYRAGTNGNCPTVFDDDWEEASDDGDGRYYTNVDGVGDAPCFSFAVEAGGRIGEIVTFQTGGEPAPGAPQATGVVHRLYGSYRIALSEVPRFGHELLALVRPQGQCAPGAWPDGEFPDDYLVSPDDDAYDVYDVGIARACVTVYLIDGQGRIGPGVALQAPPAPAPPQPVLADVSLRPTEDAIRFHTTVDEDRFQLVAVVAETCFATWTDDLAGDVALDRPRMVVRLQLPGPPLLVGVHDERRRRLQRRGDAPALSRRPPGAAPPREPSSLSARAHGCGPTVAGHSVRREGLWNDRRACAAPCSSSTTMPGSGLRLERSSRPRASTWWGRPGTESTALEAVAELRPDIVLLDIQLPGIDGLAVADRIASTDAPPAVVLVSSRDAAAYGDRLRPAAVCGFIPKSALSGAAVAALVG